MDDDRWHSGDEPPAKRQRVLACRRCRQRKQRCEDVRPCSNCVKSGEECIPTAPAPRPHVESGYVRSLEERIAELESLDPQQSLDHIRASNNAPPNEHQQAAVTGAAQNTNGAHAGTDLNATLRNGSHRRLSQALADSPTGAESMTSPASLSRTSVRSREVPSHLPNLPKSATIAVEEDEDSGLDHLVLGLVTSPTHGIEQSVSASGSPPFIRQSLPNDKEYLPHSSVTQMPAETEELLLDAYRDRAQAQYPFFHWDAFLFWQSDWKNCPPSELGMRSWQGFFVNMVYATSLLLLRLPHVGRSDSQTFYRNGIALLPTVLEKPNVVLHVQAYLLLTMHALHQSSTQRIISLASTTMRYCVQRQLHLSETEPRPLGAEGHVAIQVRRRCFWCAYKVDRLVMSAFDLPPSIPDAMITAQVFANIDDSNLLRVALETTADGSLTESDSYTCVSPSLHILQCRRIQSEISAITLRWDYEAQFEHLSDWRIRILAELENYKSRVQKFSDPQSKGYTSQRWLAMIYHYTLLMLYRPTKESALGPAGDWSVQASSQACLMFRKTQMDRQVAHPWLGLLVQFQSGITLLYCFWATPPEHRTENYDSLDVSDALRACSNILAIMADRWPKADCLRDVFELLAREVPLVDRPSRPPVRLSEKTISTVREKLPQVRCFIVHRSIMRMIEEMISEDFPRLRDGNQPPQPPSVSGLLAPDMPPLTERLPTPTPPPSMAFQLPFSTQQMFNFDGTVINMQDLDMEGLPSFPGMFEFESWT